MNNLPNENYSQLFYHINVKTGKKCTPVTGVFLYSHFFTQPRLINIAQSIYCMFFIKFSAISSKLLTTFVFNKLSSYDVTIPGTDSKITWKLPISLPNISTKFKHYRCSGTVFILTNSQTWVHFFTQVWTPRSTVTSPLLKKSMTSSESDLI